MTDKQFIEAVYEIAFGDDAINRNFGHAEVIEQLEEFYNQLSDYVEKEERTMYQWPCDSEYNVPTWDKIYDALKIIDSIINYEPSDAELEHIMILTLNHSMYEIKEC